MAVLVFSEYDNESLNVATLHAVTAAAGTRCGLSAPVKLACALLNSETPSSVRLSRAYRK